MSNGRSGRDTHISSPINAFSGRRKPSGGVDLSGPVGSTGTPVASKVTALTYQNGKLTRQDRFVDPNEQK
jgi:hypothetical protein